MKRSYLSWSTIGMSLVLISISMAHLLRPDAAVNSVSNVPIREKAVPPDPIVSIPNASSPSGPAEDRIESGGEIAGAQAKTVVSPAVRVFSDSTSRSPANADSEWRPLVEEVHPSGLSARAAAESGASSQPRQRNVSRREPVTLEREGGGTFFVRVDPAVAGNSLVVGGLRATVDGYIPSDKGGESQIQVSVKGEPEPISSPSPGRDRKSPQSQKAPQSSGYTAGGLSYEEQLFRTKWGWKAFAEAQRIAKEQNAADR